MDRINLHAEERKILGKKVKRERKNNKLPGHVFGKGLEGENVLVNLAEFLKVFHQAGETGLIDLKIGTERVRPVLIREVQYDPVSGKAIHIDFYQVNLSEKVKVSVPLLLIGEQPELVHLGEAIVLQTLNEVEVEALPTDLVEKIEADITPLKTIDDAITVNQLSYDREKLTLHVDPETIIVKLAPAVTAEMEKLMEEQAAETAAAQVEAQAGEGAEAAPAEGEEAKEGEVVEDEASAEGGEAPAETKEPNVEEQKPQ